MYMYLRTCTYMCTYIRILLYICTAVYIYIIIYIRIYIYVHYIHPLEATKISPYAVDDDSDDDHSPGIPWADPG